MSLPFLKFLELISIPMYEPLEVFKCKKYGKHIIEPKELIIIYELNKMVRISKNGKGKTLYIELSIYPCGEADPTKNLTISCPDSETRFKTTLSDYGLRKFRDCILKFYKEYVLSRTT